MNEKFHNHLQYFYEIPIDENNKLFFKLYYEMVESEKKGYGDEFVPFYCKNKDYFPFSLKTCNDKECSCQNNILDWNNVKFKHNMFIHIE